MKNIIPYIIPDGADGKRYYLKIVTDDNKKEWQYVQTECIAEAVKFVADESCDKIEKDVIKGLLHHTGAPGFTIVIAEFEQDMSSSVMTWKEGLNLHTSYMPF